MAGIFGKAATYEAVNRYGRVVRTFSDEELAQAYKVDMEIMGSPIVIRQARHIVSYMNSGSNLVVGSARRG